MDHLLEHIFMSRELYQSILKPVCDKYDLTGTELIILLFLDENPPYDTATDIVEKRRLTKSSISMAVRNLEEKGFVVGEYVGRNRRSIHLKLQKSARPVICDGRAAQEDFFGILADGFSEEEKERLKTYFSRVNANIEAYHKRSSQK